MHLEQTKLYAGCLLASFDLSNQNGYALVLSKKKKKEINFLSAF